MKAIQVFLVIMGLIVGAGVVSVIRSRAQYGEILHKRSQFERLKPGDRIVYVCRQCDGMKEILLTSASEATELYREGATFICPGCNDKMTVVSKITPGAPGSDGEVRFVNERGHECLTVAMALPKK